MSLQEKLYHSRVEGREEGREKGIMEEKIRTARTLHAMKIPVVEIAKILNIPLAMAT